MREAGRLVAKECECRELQVVNRKLELAEIDDDFVDVEIADYQITKEYYSSQEAREQAIICKKSASEYVSRYQEMKSKGKGLYFCSQTAGSGKTMLVAAMGNELVRRYQAQVRFVTAGELLSAIRATYSQDSKVKTHQLIEAAKKVEVLIVDDLGQQRVKADTNDHLFDIFNYRIKSDVVTIFSSNCKMEELPYDYRIKNRIMKMAIPIQAPEESVRRNLAKEENSLLLHSLLTG